MSLNEGLGQIHGQEAFMANISSRLGRKQPLTVAPIHPFRGAPEFYKDVVLNQQEQIQLFTKNWTALTGKVLVVKQAEAKEAIAAWLLQVCAELEVTKVTRHENDRLNKLDLDSALGSAGIHVVPWKERDTYAFPEEQVKADSNWAQRSALFQSVERCKLGIVWPDYAIANTSTLVLQANAGNGRSVSLVTEVLFAIFRADQLVTRMGEALAGILEVNRANQAHRADESNQVNQAHQSNHTNHTNHTDHAYLDPRGLSSSINMITGPSRSADIENDLTIGIHGPGKVYAVIIE